MARRLFSIAANTFRETVRNKILVDNPAHLFDFD